MDSLFEDAFECETSPANKEKTPSHYKRILDFLEILSKVDDEAFVNYGPWYPPMLEWNEFKDDGTKQRWWDIVQHPLKLSSSM